MSLIMGSGLSVHGRPTEKFALRVIGYAADSVLSFPPGKKDCRFCPEDIRACEPA